MSGGHRRGRPGSKSSIWIARADDEVFSEGALASAAGDRTSRACATRSWSGRLPSRSGSPIRWLQSHGSQRTRPRRSRARAASRKTCTAGHMLDLTKLVTRGACLRAWRVISQPAGRCGASMHQRPARSPESPGSKSRALVVVAAWDPAVAAWDPRNVPEMVTRSPLLGLVTIEGPKSAPNGHEHPVAGGRDHPRRLFLRPSSRCAPARDRAQHAAPWRQALALGLSAAVGEQVVHE
jgi:hypothetical protein